MSDTLIIGMIGQLAPLITALFAAYMGWMSFQQSKRNTEAIAATAKEVQATAETIQMNTVKVDEFHKEVNSQMTKMLLLTEKEANLQGRKELKQEQDATAVQVAAALANAPTVPVASVPDAPAPVEIATVAPEAMATIAAAATIRTAVDDEGKL